MPERATLTELIQIGEETTYGTAVAATRKLASLMIDVSPDGESFNIEPSGYKVPTGTVQIREFAGGDIAGGSALTYNELPIILNSLLKKVTPTTTTGVSTWVWDWSPTTIETVSSYTVEQGDAATRAHKISGALFTGFNFTVTRGAAPTVGGTLLGGAFTDGITPTAALTAMTPIPVAPGQIDVYSDTAWAGVGTTKLLRVFEAAFSVTNMWGPLWALNSTVSGFAAVMQIRPEITMTLTVEADSAGMAFLASNWRTNTPTFLQIKATGPSIAGGTPTTAHSLKIDMAAAVSGPPTFGDTDGARTAQWPFSVIADGTSGKALRVTLVNGVASAP
jgi:hypothetical protein